jgi:PBP1b-binding outer membrane lipoprotein LpoB
MKISSLIILSAAVVLTGCASVTMAPKEESTKAKQFAQPSGNNAGLYV